MTHAKERSSADKGAQVLGTGLTLHLAGQKGALKSQKWSLPENCSTLAVNTVVTAPSLSTNPDTAVCSVICRTTYPLVILLACIF